MLYERRENEDAIDVLLGVVPSAERAAEPLAVEADTVESVDVETGVALSSFMLASKVLISAA